MQGAWVGTDATGQLVLLADLGVHPGVKYTALCVGTDKKCRVEGSTTCMRGLWKMTWASFRLRERQSRPVVFYINKSYTWQNIFLSKFLRVYMGLLSNYNVL